jgi:hypothetical protein
MNEKQPNMPRWMRWVARGEGTRCAKFYCVKGTWTAELYINEILVATALHEHQQEAGKLAVEDLQ